MTKVPVAWGAAAPKVVPASLSERRALTAIIASGLIQGSYKDADPGVVAARASRIAEAIEEKVK